MARSLVVSTALLLLTGCANISGLSSLDIDQGDGGATGDAGDAKVDVAADAPPVCQKTETDCTDGIDNDCNGKTDCEETSCTGAGYACVDEVPSGQFGWLANNATTACPGTSQPTDLVTGITGSGTACTCSCTGSTTCPGTVSVDNTENNQCGAINNSRTLTLDNACHAANFDIQITMKSTLTGSATCTPKATLPTVTTTAGRICKSQLPKGGGGCGTGRACLPITPLPSFKACMIMPTNATCPTSWPAASTVGTQVTDSRTCGACSCSQNGTCTGSVQFFQNSSCLANAVATVPFNGCQQTGVGATTIASYKASTVAGGGCSPQTPTSPITGTATVGGQLSLCCAN